MARIKTVYLVVDRLKSGTVFLESEIEGNDLDTVIDDLIAGQFNEPVRILAFNTLEHWSDDVSTDIAREAQIRCDIASEPIQITLKILLQAMLNSRSNYRCAWSDLPLVTGLDAVQNRRRLVESGSRVTK